MDSNDYFELQQQYHGRLDNTPTVFHRYAHTVIDWGNRLIGIKGARGVGKTTLVLQHAKEAYGFSEEALYVSLDNLWFSDHSLVELAHYFYLHGGRHLFLDEVHCYKQWQTTLKNLYDDYPDMTIVYTGSSMLQMAAAEGDLSRRLMDYEMRGMSFREYLSFEGVMSIAPIPLEQLLADHVAIAHEVKRSIPSVLPLFEQYLRQGYYPFYKEVSSGFNIRLQHIVSQILEVDYPAVDEISVATIRKAKKMLMVLAEHVPQVPTMNTLYAQLETDRSQGMKILYSLARGGLLALLTDNTKSLKVLCRPEKIFLNNTNLMYALGRKTDIGTIRETFFMNQLSQGHQVSYPAKGDFLVDGIHLFEVGGADKTFRQIKDEPHSYLAIDGVEYGMGNRIPLWMFGLLY